MNVLKAEFGHHAEKLDEYDQMRKEIDRFEGECSTRHRSVTRCKTSR